MAKLNLVGAGKVGQTLFRLLAACDQYELQDITAASIETAQKAASFIGTGRAVPSLREMRTADIWFVTVPDRSIVGIAEDLAATCQENANEAVVVHCSGSLSSSVMAPLAPQGWSLASLHPVMSFARPEESCRQFPGTWCGLEGDIRAKRLLMPLVAAIGGQAFEIQTHRKMLYHAAAVFSNNFTVVLQAIAQAAWAKAGLPDHAIHEINRTLLLSTVDNITAVGPGVAITGPAARGDEEIVNKQGRLVNEWSADAGSIYQQMSVLARRLKEQGELP